MKIKRDRMSEIIKGRNVQEVEDKMQELRDTDS